MLDIKFIKENKEIVAAAIKNKNKDVDLDQLLAFAEEKKALRQQLDELNQKRNEAAKARNIEEGKRLKQQSEELEAKFAEADKKYLALMLKVPNVPSVDTPIGKDESGNKVIRQWGEKPQFAFPPKEHFELGEALGIIDNETAGRVTGSRFTYLKGDLALLQFAILQFCLNVLSSKEKLEHIAKDAGLTIAVAPFIPVVPPVFVKSAVMNRMARLHPIEERYFYEKDDIVLVGSAEHTLGPIHMDAVLEEKEMPIRYAGYSPAFRREAGSYGKDMKGILRLHQFDKLELEVFSLAENSMEEQNFLVALQEYLLQSLRLPYQVVSICTGDMGFPDYRQIDIETWMPGQNTYRETHTSDLMTSFQSRRLNTRVKRADGNTEFVHMNDATFVAMGRMLIAIIENYQQADGSIAIPEVLHPYMMGKKVITKNQ
jgi:seryl-tRNA synthetase